MPGCLSSEKHEQDHLFYKNLKIEFNYCLHLANLRPKHRCESRRQTWQTETETIPNNTQQTHKFDYWTNIANYFGLLFNSDLTLNDFFIEQSIYT